MTREKFIDFTKDHIIYLDGATGSNLVKAGMPSGVCPEQWILEHREVMLQLQKEYVQAGTNILYAPTFTANRVKLAEYHLEKNMSSMIHDLVAISKEAAASTPGHPVYVAGDITMTGEQLRPMGKMELEDLIAIYKEQILCLVDAGADLLVVETMMSLAETRAALIAAKEVCDLPVIATLTFEADGRTLFGTDAKRRQSYWKAWVRALSVRIVPPVRHRWKASSPTWYPLLRYLSLQSQMPDCLFWMKTELPAITWRQKSLPKKCKYW